MKQFFLFSCLLMSLSLFSQVEKTTYDYAIKANDTLRLDKYEVKSDTVKPCLMFVFGGGFVGGARDQEYYLSYFEAMAQKGYVVVSVDYRLGLKPIAEKLARGEKVKKLAFPQYLADAIDTAVEDVFDATNYVLSKKKDWRIDPEKISISGSSAGAITSLQAEYYICSDNVLADKLPDSFNYAGIISFAGAVFSTNGNLHWKQKPAPVLFFHGNADSNVPYDKEKILKYRFVGSKALVEQIKEKNGAYYFYDVNNANHSIALTPMKNNLAEIDEFLTNYVDKKQPLEIHKEVSNFNDPELNQKIKIKDYVTSNFTPPAQ